MKKTFLTLIAVLTVLQYTYAQTLTNPTTLYEWNNNGQNSGEVIVATLNSGTIGSYTGASIVGQIIDGHSNWGQAMPIVANFKLFINFSQSVYSITQDVITPDITLELKAISSTQIAVVANCPNIYKQTRVLFRYTNGNGPTLTVGDPTVVTTAGTMLVSQPTYLSILNGTLLIGKAAPTNPSYLLDVGGNVRANQITVNVTGADFVFEPSYSLLSLADLKKYIDQNHHLPEIESAKQMETDGLNLGDNQTKLLQKIEELTLYLIEKDKENKDQSEKLNNQQEQINQLMKQLDALTKSLGKSK